MAAFGLFVIVIIIIGGLVSLLVGVGGTPVVGIMVGAIIFVFALIGLASK